MDDSTKRMLKIILFAIFLFASVQTIRVYDLQKSKELVEKQLHELISKICVDSKHEYCNRIYPKNH